MRIWHVTLLVFMVALACTLGREPAGRVAMVVFATGVAELICATTAVMMLFQTFGSIGEAKGHLDRLRGLAASACVLVVAGGMMAGMLTLGLKLVFRVV